MEIGFENSLRVTLIHVKYCQWALFSPPYTIRMFLKRKWVKAICRKSIFMEGPAFLRHPYISIFIKLCHSAFIYFILPPLLPTR